MIAVRPAGASVLDYQFGPNRECHYEVSAPVVPHECTHPEMLRLIQRHTIEPKPTWVELLDLPLEERAALLNAILGEGSA